MAKTSRPSGPTSPYLWLTLKPCGECKAEPGEYHNADRNHGAHCSLEQCGACGLLWSNCECPPSVRHRARRVPWRGAYPGALECQEFGWYTRAFARGGNCKPCSATHPEAIEDLSRLAGSGEAKWDRRKQRYVLIEAPSVGGPTSYKGDAGGLKGGRG